jgi:hypothetical protein
MARVALVLAAVAACGGSTPSSTVDGPSGDAASDAVAQPDSNLCWGIGLARVCFAQMPTGTLLLTTPISTDGNMCAGVTLGPPNSCVIAADRIQIDAGVTVVATGSRSLVLVGTSTILIDGHLDASSHHNPDAIGAGADPAQCTSGTAASNHGGGAGGSFAGQGGGGGAGPGGTGGAVAPAGVTPTSVRGGCSGTIGSGGSPGAGGHGGGAVYLISGGDVMVNGVIDASGEGGDNGSQSGPTGGCGGGAGGMIGLDAPQVQINSSAQVFANGGGGGGGGATGGGGGNGGSSTSATVAGAGGPAGPGGGVGGAGSLGSQLQGGAGNSASNGNGSGGAGGGGAGAILIYGTSTVKGAVSPPAS